MNKGIKQQNVKIFSQCDPKRTKLDRYPEEFAAGVNYNFDGDATRAF